MIALHRTKLMFFHFKFTIRTNNDFYTSLRAVVSTRNTMLVHFYFKNKSKRNGTCLSLKKSIALRFPTSVIILVQFVPNCFQHYLSLVLILLGILMYLEVPLVLRYLYKKSCSNLLEKKIQ